MIKREINTGLNGKNKITSKGTTEYKTLFLVLRTNRGVCFVDEIIYYRFELYKFKWTMDNSENYAYTRINGKKVYMHRYIMEKVYGEDALKNKMVDHLNHERFNNTLENLRIVTAKENRENICDYDLVYNHRTGKYKYTGYRYHAHILKKHPEFNHMLEEFSTFEEAKEAVCNFHTFIYLNYFQKKAS